MTGHTWQGSAISAVALYPELGVLVYQRGKAAALRQVQP